MSRRVRSDKKKQIAPTIPDWLKIRIEQSAHDRGEPIKVRCENIALDALRDKKTLNTLAKYFRRGVLKLDYSLYRGDIRATPLPKIPLSIKNKRVSIRFNQPDYEDIAILSNMLDVTPSRAVSVLLEVYMTGYVNGYEWD